jgi:ABC-type polysaccharide/polyol phosphate export permease
MRYLVESATTVLFWLVGIFYSPPSASLPWLYAKIDNYDPLSALILSLRLILRDGRAPDDGTLVRLAFSALFMFAFGLFLFNKLRRRFYDHL